MNSTQKQQFKENYPYRLELHAHTSPASSCGELSPEDAVRLYHALGYDGIVITNHFSLESLKKFGEDKSSRMSAYLSDFERAHAVGEHLGMHVYLGAELRFPPYANDYLLFGTTADALSQIYDCLHLTFEEWRTQMPLDESLLIMAHPFRDGMVRPEDTSLLDGVEVFNMHPGHNSRIALAAKYAKEHHFNLITAGSDFHSEARLHHGNAATRLATLPEDTFALAKLLRAGEYVVEIGESIILP